MRLQHWLAPAAVAFAAAAFAMWSQMTGLAWTDYDNEAATPVADLLAGNWHGFVSTAPAYGPSLLMRSPFAYVTDWLGGGEVAIYRMLAVPCLLAGMAFGLVLWRLRRTTWPLGRWSLLFVVLAAGNPVTLRALDIGHPEELLGAVCSAGAVLAALRGRAALASALLGIALANKAWAVVAVPVVFVALPHHRVRSIVAAGVLATVFIAPFLIADASSGAGGVVALGSHTSTIFQPWQVWWPLGDLGHTVVGGDGLVKLDYRYPPEWLGPVSHPLIAVSAIPLALAWRRRRGDERTPDVLLLLSLAMLLRCVLDPWNIGYYHLPFLLALLAWEAIARERPPVLSLAAAGLVWFSFEQAPKFLSPDAQSLFYLAWALPAVWALAAVAYRLPLPRGAARMPATA